jgi:hypothetical protein
MIGKGAPFRAILATASYGHVSFVTAALYMNHFKCHG